MAEVERETGVPASTLYQWAARGGWRAADLAEAAVREAFAQSSPPPDQVRGQSAAHKGPAAGRPCGDFSQSSFASAQSAAHEGPARSRACGLEEPGAPGMGEDEAASESTSPSPEGSQGRPPAGPDGPPDRADAREDREDSLPIPLTRAALLAEADRCAGAAMALSRAGRIREAEGTLKLAGHYRALADAVGADEDAADERSEEEIQRRIFVAVMEREARDFEKAKGWVHSALCGKVFQLPGWAADKDFLADTLYPEMWYRHGGIGTGIFGHYGPGPADYLVENGGDGVRPKNLRAQYPTLVFSEDPKDGSEDVDEDEDGG